MEQQDQSRGQFIMTEMMQTVAPGAMTLSRARVLRQQRRIDLCLHFLNGFLHFRLLALMFLLKLLFSLARVQLNVRGR